MRQEIKPGIGLGGIRFGMASSEVEELLGNPEERKYFENDLHFYYPTLGIYLFFPEEDGGQLSGIEVDATCDCLLFGEQVFPRTRQRMLDLLEVKISHRCPPVQIEADGETRVTCKELAMDFYFDRTGWLRSVNWSLPTSS
jgi:hypothetical protein